MSSITIKSTKTKVLVFIIISLSLFVGALVTSIYISGKKELVKEKKLYGTNTTFAYENILKNYEIYYQSKLESILSIKGVIDAIEKKDRLALHRLVEERWINLKKENKDIKILHFHKADGLTLLRMHNVGKYDDDIAKKRAMCAFMHRHQKPIASFEAGIHLLGYRVMLPIFNNGIYLGAIEIGVKPNFVLDKMKENYNISGVVFAKNAEIYDKKLIDNTKFKIGNYRLESNTLENKELINYFPKNYNLDHDTILKTGDKIYAVYLFDHQDFKGEISAKTLIFNDITSIEDNFLNSLIEIILYSIVFLIILIIAIKIGFEKMLDKIDSTNKMLEKNVAFLRSHKLAMNESSIVSKADLKGNITYVNDKFCEVTGYTKKEVIGKPHSLVRHPSTPKEVFEELWSTIKSKKVWKGVLLNRGKKDDYWVDIAILPILDEDDEIVEYIAVRHDITQMIKQQQKLDNAANTDSMTGLGSRYKLTQDINNSKNPAIAIFNIDRFSHINDFYGHEKGDKVIYMLGFILSEMLDEDNYRLYHLQGDEFVILHSDIKQEAFIEKITDITTNIQTSPIDLDDEELFLNLSTSISFEEKDKILITADMALKIAKKENKSIVVYNEFISLNEEYENNMKWAKKVKEAIETDSIIPVFQPIVNNSTNKWEKYESLVRLKDGDALISPYFFLDIAKKTKYYVQITKTMIKKSFEVFKEREEEFSINLTIEDILDEDINNYIIDMLQKYEIGSRVVFEIVESESIENFEQIYQFIQKVKSYGAKIAIDDFGTGYSNFEYLLKLKADYIKIDGSMIKDIDTNKETELVVSTIVEFANKMGMKTIAEFVENESILQKINELGIDYSQGYHFSKPYTIDNKKD